MVKKTLTELTESFADNGAGLITGADMQNYIRNSASWTAAHADGTAPDQSLTAATPVVINQWTSTSTNDTEAEAILEGNLQDAPNAWTVVAGYSGVIGIQFTIGMSLSNSNGIFTMTLRINGTPQESVTFETSGGVNPYSLSFPPVPLGLSSGDVIDFTIESVANETFDMLLGTIFAKRVL